MTSSSRFLNYEVALLLAKYGKTALLAALAEHLQLTSNELDALLQKAPKNKAEAGAKKRHIPVDLLGQLSKAYPDKAKFLRMLHARFGNRTFLPELRDVRRFFEEHDRRVSGFRSRADALPRVLKLLGELDIADLDSLCHEQPEGEYSSLGVIAEEILRKDR